MIRRSLPQDVMLTLLQSFVANRLDYCNSLLFGLPACDIRRLQSVQNAAAHLFGGLARHDHVTPVLRDKLHWLPITKRIDFKVAVMVFKCINGLAPSYLNDMCMPVALIHTRSRAAVRGDLVVPRWKSAGYGKRGFQHSAPTVWNSLPTDVRTCQSLQTFKSKLKTFLFRSAYLQ